MALNFRRLRWALLVAVVLLLPAAIGAAAPKNGQASYLEQAQALSRQILRNPAAPESLLALNDLRGLDQYLPDRKIYTDTCRRLARNPKLPVDMRVRVGWCLTSIPEHEGDAEGLKAAIRDIGYMGRFMIIGPFDNEGGVGMDTVHPPEQGFDPAAEYDGKERPVGWRSYPEDLAFWGALKPGDLFTPDHQALAYGYGRIHSKRAQKGLLLVSVGGEAKVWLNGELLLSRTGEHKDSQLQDAIPISLKKGINEIVFKSGTRDGKWRLRLGLLDKTGKRMKNIAGLWTDESADKLAPFPQKAVSWALGSKAVAEPIALATDKLITRFDKKPSAKLAVTISRLLGKRRHYPKEERLDEQWADKALELDKTLPEVVLWCNEVYSDINKRFTCLQEGNATHPDDPRIAMKLAKIYREENQYLKTKALIEPILDHPAVIFQVQAQMASLESAKGFDSDAYLRIKALHERFPEIPYVAWLYSSYSADNGYEETAAELVQQLAKRNPLETRILRWLTSYYRGRRDIAQVHKLLDMRITLSPGTYSLYMMKAGLQEGAGDYEAARQTYERILAYSPEDTLAIEALARVLHRMGKMDEAMALYKRSLKIHPQNPELKQYLRLLEPAAERFEAPYVLDVRKLIEQFPARKDTSERAEILADVGVWKVFDNGLSSEFHQQVIRVYNDSGVKRFRSYSAGYSPGRQTVKILQARIIKPDGKIVEKVYENDYSAGGGNRMYYDMRVKTVQFPDLEPGDVVEFQYRTDDVARKNLFADYFGTMRLMQFYTPIRHWRTVILMPKGRTLYYNSPSHAKEPVVTEQTKQVQYDWQANDLPKIEDEPDAPALIALADYLLVSTFKDWDAMGRWYWGLIKDQFIAKQDLKQQVAELVAGIDDPLARIRAIHEWVVRNTRYVALEFGVHSFKPYQVNQIFQRRFGDCKDKATLLITMLKEAGINAQMAIIRTSNIGQLPEPYPPSLSMFNHAIVYLPDQDMYLDGTAEYSGMEALPWQDRRGQVMLIGTDGATFTQVPPVDPKLNSALSKSTVTLKADGSATVSATFTIIGTFASMYRSYFQDAERQKELLEKLLNRSNPGTELLTFTFTGLDKINEPVVIRFEARVPDYMRNTGDGKAKVWMHLTREDLVKDYATLSSRQYPVEISNLTTHTWRTELILPAGASVEHLPEAVTLDTDFATFSASARIEGDRVLIETTLTYKQNMIDLDTYPAFREFCQAATQAFEEEIRLNVDTTTQTN